jgi:hypothetical protein
MRRFQFETTSCVFSPTEVLYHFRIFRVLAAFAVILIPIAVQLLSGQESSQLLIPTEAYKAALAPYQQTRSQMNDLTDADKSALRIGMAQASRDCLMLSSNLAAYSGNAKELFGLGQLCLFGRQFESARGALVSYLALPQPPQKEQALALLVRTFLGLESPLSAEAQVDSLLRDYPYDPIVNDSIDQVIDYTEGVTRLNLVALKLCTTQSTATLPLLSAGKILEGKDGNASATAMFSDAVRCAALAKSSGKPGDLKDLAAVIQAPGWAGTADQVRMHAAFERQQMVGSSAPRTSLRGYLPGIKSPIPRVVSLTRGTALLVPFALWSPSTPEITRNLAKLIPTQPIYAITSWHANTGGEDVQSNEVLAELRVWQHTLPKQVSILIVPDTVLSEFHCDVFPAGILIRDGNVLSNVALSRQGDEKLVKSALAQMPEQNDSPR